LGDTYLKTYIGSLAAFAVILATSWSYWYGLTFEPRLVVGAVVFACFILAGEFFSISLSKHVTIGVSSIPIVIAVAAMGPTWAALAALPAALFLAKRDALRVLYEAGHYLIMVYLAGIVFSFASQPLLLDKTAPLATILYGTLMLGLTQMIASDVISAALLKVKYNQTFHESWQEMIQPYLLSEALNVLTAGLGVVAFVTYGPVVAVVVVVGSVGSLALAYRTREQVKENNELRARVKSLEEALANSNMTFGTMIIRDLGQKDGYTHRHAAATATYAADLAREMKLDDTHVERLRMAGLLHNIGLFGLPDEMLLATGRPNSIARSRLDEHPARGEEALASVSEFEEMAAWVRWHHERPDGRGYPDKLRGPWIPLEARILSVAQAYAAMILDQPRRPGMTPAEAREQLSAGIDTAFDGVVVRALLRLLDTESEGYRMADDHRFVFPSLEGGARPGASDPRRDEDLGRTLPR
jgi:HD-GYP domain-containing protein (c-di-GMP phosphodiesterase class II)